MKKSTLENLSVAELLERFATIAVEEDKATFEDDNARYNRLFLELEAVENELKSRPGDQRRELLSLFDHPNIQVRLMAAKATLAVAPEAARKMLQAIEGWRRQPYAGDAGMCLVMLDRGIFVPK